VSFENTGTRDFATPNSSLNAEHGVQLRRAVVASTVGSVIESYDFLLYVLIAPLVFAKLYFPSSDPLVGTLQAFGIWCRAGSSSRSSCH
jgi:hypothetical protein